MVTNYGEFYSYERAISFTIKTANTYQAFGSKTGGDILYGILSGFSFSAGGPVDLDIANEQNPTGAVLRIVCSVAHNLATNDIVTLAGMNNAGHNKTTRVTVVNSTTFDCQDITYISGAGTSSGAVYAPAYLKASAGSDGTYFVSLSIDGTAQITNRQWKWELNVGIVPKDNIVTERVTTATLTSVSTSGIVSLAAGDIVWVSAKNITDTTDYVVRNMNLSLHKIGT